MFCRIYVTAKNIEGSTLLLSVSHFLDSKLVNSRYIETNGYSIEVRPNADFNDDKQLIFPDGFLFFPLSIEIDMIDEITREVAAKKVGEILDFLWKSGYAAIASCDFENLLPENGGYKSKNIPWPTQRQ